MAHRWPERVATLTMCACQQASTAESAKLWRERAETVLRDGLEPIVDSAMRRWFAPEFLEEDAGRARNL
jgi:hypothetical protein